MRPPKRTLGRKIALTVEKLEKLVYKTERRLDNLKAQLGKYVLQLEDLKKLQKALGEAREAASR